MSGAPKELILGLFNICTDDLDKGIVCTVFKFADDTELGGTVLLESWKALQRVLDNLDHWAESNCMNCNPKQLERLRARWLEN